MSARIPQEVVDLLYLCGRGLAGEAADPARVQQMDLARVHSLATSQSLAALSWYGLETAVAGASLAGPLFDKWRSIRDKAIRKQMLFGAERAQICAWLEKSGIWFALLKGAVLEGWYPRLGMREFTDNDILYDATRRDDVVRFFRERGYDVNPDGHVVGLDDSFTKEPVFNFEMHARLFANITSTVFAEYYADVRSKLVGVDGSPCQLRFSDEDALIYLLAHAYKHYEYSGTGLRILCDLWVIRSVAGERLDQRYLERELQTLGITEFVDSLERLSARVFASDFDPSSLCDEDVRMLLALSSFGAYGTYDHKLELELERKEEQGVSTSGYVLGRIMPDDDWWDVNFPFANRHKWARPPLLVFRAVRAVFEPERRHRVAAELRAILRKKDSQ